MVAITSPVALNGTGVNGEVTRLRTPDTTVPFEPCGVIVTVTVPVAPGGMSFGVPSPVEGFTALRNGSPVELVTAGSNAFVTAVPRITEVPEGAPAFVNGPICWG